LQNLGKEPSGINQVQQYNIAQSDEGLGQEVSAWHALESIFPFGIYRSLQVEEPGNNRELTDIFCHYELGTFLIESKALGVYGSIAERTMERKVRMVHKHIRKALSQLHGALRSIKKGFKIKTPQGQLIEFDRRTPPHCIILVRSCPKARLKFASKNAARISRGIFGGIQVCARSGPAQDCTEDLPDSRAIIARAVTIVVVVTTILAKACVIALDETISKSL